MTELLSVVELADGVLPPTSADDVVLFVDLATADGLGADSVQKAAAALQRDHHVFVGVGVPGGGATAAALLEAVTVTLVDRDSAAAADRRTVAVDDVPGALTDLSDAIAARPIASATLAGLLRMQRSLDVHDALVAESLAYSTLQGGSEYASWLAAADYALRPETAPPVRAEREGDSLAITLTRPRRHNALNAAMRDGLVDALTVALVDPTVDEVVLAGDGPSFCSGGDLAEFGTAPDPATAHLVRVEHRPGEQLHELTRRIGPACEARVHGAVMGGGLEIAAFAGRVVADSGTRMRLPELSMGLVPGAGGTVSVARRIGRWRTAWMVITGRTLDIDTALDWGLVDEIGRVGTATGP